MGESPGVSVEQVVSLLTRRRARLPFEIGAFVALEACERLVTQGPSVVQPADVHIDGEGHVTVIDTGRGATSPEAARAVARVLARLLVAAGHGVPPSLVQLVEEGPEGAQWDLVRLRDELEASLVPLNRAAARRVLSRVLRDAQREAPAPPPPAAQATPPATPAWNVDADLDAFLDEGFADRPTGKVPPVPTSGGRPQVRAERPHLRATPDMARPMGADASGAPEPREAPVVERPAAPEEFPPAPMRPAGAVQEAKQPPGPAMVEHDDGPPRSRSRARKGVFGAVGLVAALFAVLAAVGLGARDRFAESGSASDPGERDGASADEPHRGAEAPHHRMGRLTVHVEPEGAQVLRFIGRGPATAAHLPVGVVHEFVAVAPGRLPTRAVIPGDAKWGDEEGDGPRYELAMQTGDASRHARELELGPSKRPKARGIPAGPVGTARIITNPPGAKVYHLIGVAPDVEALELDTSVAHELLVYREGYEPERLVVGPSDWESSDGGPLVARLRVSLERRAPTERERN